MLKTRKPTSGIRLTPREKHGARSQAFYDTTLFWQWMRLPGDIVFSAGALLMAGDFVVKLKPLLGKSVGGSAPETAQTPAE